MNMNALETCYHTETFRKNRFRRFTLIRMAILKRMADILIKSILIYKGELYDTIRIDTFV